MPIGPTIYFEKERVFVDRELCIQAFRENIHNSGTLKYNILFYYGIAGIGKSKLQKELQKILDDEYPYIFWVPIDFDISTYWDISTFLITLRNKIQEKCDAEFHIFNAVHAIYWKKAHPETQLPKQNYPLIEKGEFLEKIIDVLDNSGQIILAWEILNRASESFRSWLHLHYIDIFTVELFESNRIKELLPAIFAADFSEYLYQNSNVYIFIDTYEALWEGIRDKDTLHQNDKWVRDDLFSNMPGISWIISGREELRWASICDPDWEMFLEQYQVAKLSENDCIQFLEECCIENKDIRDIIIEASEGVPYYLNLSVDTFEKIKIYKKRQPISEDFGKTQPEIFKKFVKYLDKSETHALKVLSATNFWDRDLFEILMTRFDTGLQVCPFSDLIKSSFIRENTNGEYSIHRLMRKSLREYQDPVDRKNVHKFMFEHYKNILKKMDIKSITPEHEKALIEAFYHAKITLETKDLLNWIIIASGPFNSAAFWRLIAPIYEETLQILEAKLGAEHQDVATTLNNLAELYESMEDYEKALPLFQRALDIRENVLGPQHPSVATTLNNLAELYRQMGDYEKALPLFQRALEIYEKVLGSQHPSVATILNNLAELYCMMEDYEKALPLFQRAFEISENVLGPQHPSVATTLNNLAGLYRQMGDYENALPLYQRALEISEKVLDSQHPSVATTLNNLAELYCLMEDYEKALQLYQKVLEVYENVLGSQNPPAATTLNNLAGLYRQMGDYENALPLYQRALEISEKVLDSQHPSVATTLNNLAELYCLTEDYEKALSLFQKALSIRENVLGSQHPSVATTLNNLAELYCLMEDYEKALPLFQKALGIRENVLSPQHPSVATTLNNLAELYRQMGDYEKALPLFQRAFEISENVLGPQHPSVATTQNNLALIYHKRGDYEKALLLYQRALEIYEKVLGPQHPSVATTLNNLAGLYRQMGDYEKALKLYQRALEIREKVLGPQHPSVATTLNKLVGLYHQMGDHEKALKLSQSTGKSSNYPKQ